MSEGPDDTWESVKPPSTAPSERRRYNRRRTEEVSPPYFAAFERMAVALEDIARLLGERQITLPEPRVERRTT